MKVIIAGGRDFKDYDLLYSSCEKILKNRPIVEVVSGAQKTYDVKTRSYHGADYLGEKYAKHRGYVLKRFPANWTKFKKSAGYLRNVEMSRYADALIAFWDGVSKGTEHMIKLAEMEQLSVRIIKY